MLKYLSGFSQKEKSKTSNLYGSTDETANCGNNCAKDPNATMLNRFKFRERK
jgi:hypothetical protein